MPRGNDTGCDREAQASSSGPVKPRGSAIGRRNSCPAVLDQAGDAARQEIDDHHEHEPEEHAVPERKPHLQQLGQQRERDDAEHRPPQPLHAAEQRHDHHGERDQRVEGELRREIAEARRHHGADHGHEHRGDDEDHHLGERHVDAGLPRHGLVVADHQQRDPEPRAPQQPAHQEHQHREPKQVLVDQRGVERHEHVAAHACGSG